MYRALPCVRGLCRGACRGGAPRPPGQGGGTSFLDAIYRFVNHTQPETKKNENIFVFLDLHFLVVVRALSPPCFVNRYITAAVVHLNFRAGSTFPVTVCTVPSSMDRTNRCNKDDAVRLYASYRLNLLLLKGQRDVHTVYTVQCIELDI